MFVRHLFLVVIVVLLLASFVSPWRRRRRRRAPPPPPVNCGVSAWSSWSDCSKKCSIGTHSRTRRVTTQPAFGGRSCPVLREGGNCGEANGGCDDRCHEDKGGTCSCTRSGYELQDDKKSCADKNECLGGTAVCVNSNCRNTDGDFACDCHPGYKSSPNPRQCVPKSCTQLTASQCPVDAYHDEFGETCMPATVNCRDGLEYQKSCTLTCVNNYRLAVIAQPKPGQNFAQDFSAVDFGSPSDLTVCSLDPDSDGVLWDWNPVTTPYYCRRVNDPPLNITISTNVINEKQGFLTSVGTLSASDPQNDHLTFSILNPDGNFYFLIQNNKMLVKVRLVWNPKSTNIYPVVVNVSDSGAPVMRSQTILQIKVLNINDPPYDLELSNSKVFENVHVNSVVGNLTAIDDDLGGQRSSNFSWEIVDTDNGHFSIRENKVLVAKSLDHESKNIHRIQVKCTDFGIPRKSSQVTSMTIIVRDTNDSPKSINLTNHRVYENSPVGFVVGYIIATDDDNDTLSFDLNETDRKGLEKFSLQGSSSCSPRLHNGKSIQTCSVPLVVNGSLDYEQESEYVIWLAVTDPGGITRKSFTIYVENVNEMPTDILISDNKVPENSPGDVVGEFLVKDPDNKNALTQNHTCSLVNSHSGDEDAFYIFKTGQRNLLRVKANKDLDFESKRLYNITVLCKDTANLDISKSFKIEITDVNEAPTSLLLSNTSVEESDLSSSFIGTLSARDPEGTNQTFTYSVRGLRSFRINGTNKDQLVHVGPIDFERTPEISVNIRVADNGGLYLEKEFLITITDVNDKPTDIRLDTNAKLKENSGVDVYISKIEMVDEDRVTIASCQLLNSSDNRVSSKDLNLLVGRTMTDYESLDSSKTLQILMKCEDQHGAAVTRWLRLPVEDENEAPTDIFLKKSEVRENEDEALVGILEIIDEDVGQRHNCSILDNKTSFFIDSTVYPPTLRTNSSLDFETSRVNYVNIKCEDVVSDHQQTPYSTEKQFKINVIDVNETPQILCNSPFHALTSFSRGSVLGRIQNYDPDNELYYSSKKRNPRGPFEIQKQILKFRFANEYENISWPFDVTLNGIIYLEKQLTVEEYNESIIFGIRVDDDGTVWERISGSEKYQIKISATKYAVENCSIVITNETEIDIHLSSNTIAENATNGTIIGKLSRQPELDQVTYHILENDNGTTPFEIDHDLLKLKLENSLDYELLPADKTFPLTISSVHPVAGVFTKQFLIKIQDVNDMPTAICLMSSRPLDDCSVVGYILIEDLDYPDLQCGSTKAVDLEKFSSKLSEYTCHIQNGVDSLSNRATVDKHFYIQNSPPRLYLNKTVFVRGDTSYNIPILCRSSRHALHILSTTLKVDIKVPDDANCRHNELCTSCPEPRFCLTHVKVAGQCVGKGYRINSTVAIPVSIFETPGFVSTFENYVTTLIEGTSQGKTLKDLVQEFNDENLSFRRRREAVYSDVYVEQFVYVSHGTSTNVVFAVAEKPSYDLISASEACKLLMNTEVKCLADDGGNNSAKKGEGDGKSGFPLWIIFVIAAVIVVAFIITLVVSCRRRSSKNHNTATVHFVRDSNECTVDSMYETPADDIDQSLSHSGLSKAKLVEKRKDIKVYNNPMYRTQRNLQGSGEAEENKKRTMNHYETADPPQLYESIEDLYEKVREETMKESDEMETKPKSKKKSRSNPVYAVGEFDNELNPVVNLAVTSPSRKVKKDGNSFPSAVEENYPDDSNDLLSTFQTRYNYGNPYENVGMVNRLALHTDDEKAKQEDAKPPSAVLNGHEDVTTPDSGQTEDSKSPLSMKNELSPLEHQNSFEVNSDDVPASPPPVYDNNELYSIEKRESCENTANHTFC